MLSKDSYLQLNCINLEIIPSSKKIHSILYIYLHLFVLHYIRYPFRLIYRVPQKCDNNNNNTLTFYVYHCKVKTLLDSKTLHVHMLCSRQSQFFFLIFFHDGLFHLHASSVWYLRDYIFKKYMYSFVCSTFLRA